MVPIKLVTVCAIVVALVVIGSAALAPAAIEVTAIYNLTQSNFAGTPPDGNYATVMLNADSDHFGSVFFTVTANPLTFVDENNVSTTYSTTIGEFGLNLSSSQSSAQILATSLPDGWFVNFDKNMDGFGKFDVIAKENGEEFRVNPLQFTVTGLTGSNIEDWIAAFDEYSSTSQGDSRFAAHLFAPVATGYDGVDEQILYVVTDTSTTTIPEPTTLIIWSLLGTLTITVGWWRRRKMV